MIFKKYLYSIDEAKMKMVSVGNKIKNPDLDIKIDPIFKDLFQKPPKFRMVTHIWDVVNKKKIDSSDSPNDIVVLDNDLIYHKHKVKDIQKYMK